MSTILLDSNNLLAYNQAHQIIICLSCQYAIQKSALPSHLLRHKIYRQEKARLLNSISFLSLLEPDFVPLPLPNSKPIDGLAVIDGWSCVKEGCGNLCASEKRMRWHCCEVHGSKDLEGEGWKRRCKLQTFFRGTKIRYFEVTADVASEGLGLEKTSEEEGTVDRDESAMDGGDTEMLNEPELSLPRISIPLSKALDLETLTYFHHFITSTSHTLPTPSTPSNNWQAIIPLALQHQNLMFGILAISSYHCAFLTGNDSAVKPSHLSKAKEFSTAFTHPAKYEKEEIPKQIQLIIYLSSLSLALFREPDKFSIHNLLSTIRALTTTTATNSPPPISSIPNIPQPLFQALNQLPYNLAKAYPTPANSEAEDIFAVLNAIRDLSACVGTSYDPVTDMGGNKWRGMITWCGLISDRFLKLIEKRDGAGAGAAEVVVYFVRFGLFFYVFTSFFGSIVLSSSHSYIIPIFLPSKLSNLPPIHMARRVPTSNDQISVFLSRLNLLFRMSFCS